MAKTKKAAEPHRVCFDIEIEPLSKEFRDAPMMQVACAYDGTKWRYFLRSEAKALIALLAAADEVITFNGKRYDERILRRHHKMSAKVLAAKGKHIDLCAIIHKEYNRQVSLDDLAQLNLGERKHRKGREPDIDALKVACRSDVWQTWGL
jgi:uncharacterized protein YprB with RNaseH-like and TPR domain